MKAINNIKITEKAPYSDNKPETYPNTEVIVFADLPKRLGIDWG